MEKKKVLFGLDSRKEANVAKIFNMLKKRELVMVSDKKTRLNSTEIRMLSEIVSARCEGKRLISTRLADLLGVTRSAVSQMVNRLEKEGIVHRVADDIDRKIAYIEISEAVLGIYGKDIEDCLNFVDELVQEFGQEKFDTMYELFEEFLAKAETRIRANKTENKKRK